MGDRCEREIDAQVEREAWKKVPTGDDQTSRLIYEGLSLSERRATERDMREALTEEARKKVDALPVDRQDFWKYGIKVDGDIITFKNGIQYNTATHNLIDTRPGSKDGGFRLETIYDKPTGDPDRHRIGLEIYGTGKGTGADRVENLLAAYDSRVKELYIPVKGGELVVDNVTGKIKFQPDKLVACKDLPELTIEEVRNRK